MDTMLHKFGHAVYDKYINPKLSSFLWTVAHTCTPEAVAPMMGSLVDDPAWLSGVAGVPKAELGDILEHILWREQADRPVFTRWASQCAFRNIDALSLVKSVLRCASISSSPRRRTIAIRIAGNGWSQFVENHATADAHTSNSSTGSHRVISFSWDSDTARAKRNTPAHIERVTSVTYLTFARKPILIFL